MFATSFPEHPESARVLTKADEELFALNEFDRVIEVSTQILERNPPVERSYQRTAATLLAHSLFDRGRLRRSRGGLRARAGLPAAERSGSPGDRRAHRGVDLQAGRGEAAGRRCHRRGRRLPARRRCWRRTRRCAPTPSTTRPASWCRTSNGSARRRCSRSFRRSYPNHELAPEVTRSLAVAYLETGRATQAAARVRAHRRARRGDAPTCGAPRCGRPRSCTRSPARRPMRRALYASYVKQYPIAARSGDGCAPEARRHGEGAERRARLARSGTTKSFVRTRRRALRAPIAASISPRRRRSKRAEPQVAMFNADQAGRAARQVAQDEAHCDGEGADRRTARRSTMASPR